MIEHERTGWIDAITWRLSRVVMYLIPFIVAIMMYEVFMRYVLEKPTLWVNEMSLWVAGWVYLLAGIYAMQQRSHIRIFMLYNIVPKWLKHVFDVMSTLFIVLWAAASVYGSFTEAWKAFIMWEKFGTAWDPPIPAITQPLILIILVVVSIQAVSNLFYDWNRIPEEITASEVDTEIEEIIRAQGFSQDKPK